MNTIATAADTYYPDSDGKRMADNTLQYEWIVALKGNLDLLFADRDDVFVAGDNLIYPVRGDNKVRQAPDVYVAFGRPKGYRGSYKVWEEGGTFPQVVFEVLSPGNRAGEMRRKRLFYEAHGAEEYYLLDPDDNTVQGWVRDGDGFRALPTANGHVSPRLGIRFDTSGPAVAVFYPDGRRFLTFVEIGRAAEQAQRQAVQAQQQAAQAQQREAQAQEQAAQAQQRATQAQEQVVQAQQQAAQAQSDNDRLRALLRAAGIDPDKLTPP